MVRIGPDPLGCFLLNSSLEGHFISKKYLIDSINTVDFLFWYGDGKVLKINGQKTVINVYGHRIKLTFVWGIV
jgi:hypothetical protein